MQPAQMSGWSPRNVSGQKCGLHTLSAKGPTNCRQLSGELSKSFFSYFSLSLGVALDLGRVASFASPLGMPLMSMGLFQIARNIYCLSLLKPDPIVERYY